ncbi:MAG: general secretion pathway protein GspB [Desulfobacterales bacterium]|nr:general secretion pathway protein GspB [Desulfobacterales bacterium]
MVALLLVGFNGFKLMSFFNPELPGQSRSVKEAMKKWRQLEDRVPATIVEALDNINLNVAFAEYTRYTPVSHKQTNKLSTPRTQVAKEKAINIKLPSLAGILRTTDAHGNTCSIAVINGGYLCEGERVSGFMVQKISEEGIILTRGGVRFSVPAPKVKFSLDQGG